MKSCTFHPLAKQEFLQAIQFYREYSQEVANTFVIQTNRAIDLLRRHPESATIVYEAGEIRRQVIPQFPYNLLYRIRLESIEVMAIAHQKRDPVYWLNRK